MVVYTHSKSFSGMKSSIELNMSKVVSSLKLNGLKMNVSKTSVLFLSRKNKRYLLKDKCLSIEGVDILDSHCVKFLGVMVDDKLSWVEHVKFIRQKCFTCLARPRKVFPVLPVHTRNLLFNALVLPHLDYCSVVLGNCSSLQSSKLDRIQKYAMRLITSSPSRTPSEVLRKKLNWMPLIVCRKMQLLMKVHSCMHQFSPSYLCSQFPVNFNLNYRSSRGINKIQQSCPSTNAYKDSSEFRSAALWNSLLADIRVIKSPAMLKIALLHYLN